MPNRVKLLIGLLLVSAIASVSGFFAAPSHNWVRFVAYAVLVVLSAGMKVAIPKGDGSMSVSFPFILLGIIQLSPDQALLLAAISVIAQCRIQVNKGFSPVQIIFNVANVVTSVAIACIVYAFLFNRKLEIAPALAIATIAYFFANTIAVALVIGWTSHEKVFHLWRREFPWYLPFYLVGALLAALVHFISIHYGWFTSLLIVPAVYTIHRAYRTQLATIAAREKHIDEVKALHLRTIEGLAMAIEAKDQGTHDHLLRVRVYVSEIGRVMKLDELHMQALVTAAFLHDIGKLAVPENIINKPGRLTPEEFEKMKIHPIVGADILERVRFPYPVTPIVRAHHEAWDGSGYPDGLAGEQIPIGARILTIIDCFDALASDRPYRRALSLEDAMAYVKSKAGTQFDPSIVSILEANYIELEKLAREDEQSIAPLATDIEVVRGVAPAAGFEQSRGAEEVPSEGSLGIELSAEIARSPVPRDALTLIATASRESRAILDLSQNVVCDTGFTDTARKISQAISRWFSFDCVAIYLNESGHLRTGYMDGKRQNAFSSLPIAEGAGLSGWVLESGKAIINGNPEVEPNYAGSALADTQLRSALSLPLFEAGEKTLGVLTLYSTQADAFSSENLRILMAVESKLSLSLKNSLLRADAGDDGDFELSSELTSEIRWDHRFSPLPAQTQVDTASLLPMKAAS